MLPLRVDCSLHGYLAWMCERVLIADGIVSVRLQVQVHECLAGPLQAVMQAR